MWDHLYGTGLSAKIRNFYERGSGVSLMNMRMEEGKPHQLPIDGVLDLHTFRPKDVKDVVCEFIEECRTAGIYELRIIHGKGIGQLRQTVHALLAKHPAVHSYALASEYYGGSGATIVHLAKV